ncbi:MAG: LmeA family phospholipid-binding protein [Candidatus Rokubacteria bacterium]|nr:LmeA family phospholipid-binding protein [Candidatus Rokubacteria bacterium]
MCGQILADRGPAGWAEIVELSSFYPPVVPCSAGVLSLVVPFTGLTAQSVILAFLALALVCLFFLGRRLFDAPTGVLAALIFGAAPFVVFSTTNFQLDLPLAAAVVFSLLAIVLTEDFSRRAWSVAAGLSFAFGMLVKPPFAVYLLPPLALVVWRALRAPDRRARALNLLLAFVLGGALSLPWYGPRLFGLSLQIANRSFKQAALQGSPEILTGAALFFYPRTLPAIFGLLAAPLFVWGLLALARRREARGLLWSASLVPFAVFLLIQNKNFRYVLPLLPVAALIAAAGLRAVAAPWRRGVTVVLVGVSALQVGAAAFALPPLGRWTAFGFPLVFSAPPSPVAWPHQQILDVIVKEAGGRPATVSVVPNYNFFSVSNFRYYAVRDRRPLKLTRAWDQSPFGVGFIILKTGDLGPDFSIAKPKRIMERLARGDPAFERAFPVIWQGPLPDGSVGSVRQRRVAPVAGVSPSDLARRFKDAVVPFLEPYARDLEGLVVDLVADPPALLRGEIREVRLQARRARVAEFSRNGAELRLRDLSVSFQGVLINPHRLAASGEIEPLAIEKLRLERLVVTEEDLQAFLAGFRGLKGLRVGLEDGAVSVTLVQPGPDVTGRLRVSNGSGPSPLTVRAERLSLGGIPLPRLFVYWVFRHFDPTLRLARLPVAVELGRIRVEPRRIVISNG